jgi:hypothetical protein
MILVEKSTAFLGFTRKMSTECGSSIL